MARLLVLAVLVAGCTPTSGGQATPEDFPTVTCTVAYRPDMTTEPESEELELRPGEERTRAFEDVEVAFDYAFSPAEGATLLVDASQPDAEGRFARDLYQFVAGQPPTGDLFAGGHGFTGLTYLQPPGSPAEAQYYCRAAEAG